jgi:hypothetical protein
VYAGAESALLVLRNWIGIFREDIHEIFDPPSI